MEFAAGILAAIVGPLILMLALAIWSAGWRNRLRFGRCVNPACRRPLMIIDDGDRLACSRYLRHVSSSRNPHEGYTMKHCVRRWGGLIIRPSEASSYVRSTRERITGGSAS